MMKLSHQPFYHNLDLLKSLDFYLKNPDKSIFPPEISAQTFFPRNLLSFKIAASTIDPDNSTIIFILSINI